MVNFAQGGFNRHSVKLLEHFQEIQLYLRRLSLRFTLGNTVPGYFSLPESQ